LPHIQSSVTAAEVEVGSVVTLIKKRMARSK
jgi:hypothetical protein